MSNLGAGSMYYKVGVSFIACVARAIERNERQQVLFLTSWTCVTFIG